MLQQEEYIKLFKENVIKICKKSTGKKLLNINRNAKKDHRKIAFL